MKGYIRRIAAALSLGIFVLPAVALPAQPKNIRGGFMAALKVSLHKSPAIFRTQVARWTQYQSCLQQNLSVSPQQSAQIAPILANEGSKVIAIRTNNSLSDVQ